MAVPPDVIARLIPRSNEATLQHSNWRVQAAVQLFQWHVRRCLETPNTAVIAQDVAVPAVRVEIFVNDNPTRRMHPRYPRRLVYIDIWVDTNNELCEDRVATRDAPYGWLQAAEGATSIATE